MIDYDIRDHWLVLAAIQIFFFNAMYFLEGKRNLNHEFKIIYLFNDYYFLNINILIKD
jgi:hypothetical protein